MYRLGGMIAELRWLSLARDMCGALALQHFTGYRIQLCSICYQLHLLWHVMQPTLNGDRDRTDEELSVEILNCRSE